MVPAIVLHIPRENPGTPEHLLWPASLPVALIEPDPLVAAFYEDSHDPEWLSWLPTSSQDNLGNQSIN